MLLIKIKIGHHKFKKPIKLFDTRGKEVGAAEMIGPGDCIKVSQADYDKLFAYRSEIIGKGPDEKQGSDEKSNPTTPPASPASPGAIVYEHDALEALGIDKLRLVASDLGYKYAARAGLEKLIDQIIALKPDEADELKPSKDWSSDRLKAYLDEAEIQYETEDPEELLALALAAFV